MGVLPIILFLLGVGFLFLGWRWQNPSNEEALTALKGLAYLKREIIRVEVHVQDLEGKLLKFEEIDFPIVEYREAEFKEKEAKELESKELLSSQLQSIEKSNLNVLNVKDNRARSHEVELQPQLTPKYQEVLELAANGERIPEIAQRLFLSQDAVRMVLCLQSKGGA